MDAPPPGTELATIANITDPLERALRAHTLVGRLAEIAGEASRLRREAVETLVEQDMPQGRIAATLGISRARVSQLLRSGPSPERALLSHDGGPVVVAIGSKRAQFGDGEPSDMISKDAARAYDVLRDALNGWSVACSQDVVPAGTAPDLNRERLIVLGSPKVLFTVGQIGESDPNIVFGQDELGRCLVERGSGTHHYSPQDTGEHADLAYVGRLPRPDMRGSFLWLAGIHAPGTHGAARYVVDHAPELYRTVKDKLFSVIVRVTYDPDTRAIVAVEPATDTYTR